MTKTELFLKLANPDEFGISRWVNVEEFVGEYASLRNYFSVYSASIVPSSSFLSDEVFACS